MTNERKGPGYLVVTWWPGGTRVPDVEYLDDAVQAEALHAEYVARIKDSFRGTGRALLCQVWIDARADRDAGTRYAIQRIDRRDHEADAHAALVACRDALATIVADGADKATQTAYLMTTDLVGVGEGGAG